MTEMLEKAIEIEGLIRILKNGTPSPEIYELIRRKADALTQWASSQTREPENYRTIGQENKKNKEQESREDVIPVTAIREEIKDDVRMEEAEKEELDAASEDDILLSLDDEDRKQCSKTDIDTKEVTAESKKQKDKDVKQMCPSNLKAYFSLNDRFLYSRELFDGNMKMFDATLRKLEGISDFSLVEDYFYNELDWDPENEYVKSFMDILQSKF